MGSSLLAFLAGATPKIMPTIKETPKANKIEFKVMVDGKNLLIKKLPVNPIKIPIRPPTEDKMTASKRN